jgi:hypothetical protein
MKAKASICQWPGCKSSALCQSGNYGNKLVCNHHFGITNGNPFDEVHRLELALRKVEQERDKLILEVQQLRDTVIYLH